MNLEQIQFIDRPLNKYSSEQIDIVHFKASKRELISRGLRVIILPWLVMCVVGSYISYNAITKNRIEDNTKDKELNIQAYKMLKPIADKGNIYAILSIINSDISQRNNSYYLQQIVASASTNLSAKYYLDVRKVQLEDIPGYENSNNYIDSIFNYANKGTPEAITDIMLLKQKAYKDPNKPQNKYIIQKYTEWLSKE